MSEILKNFKNKIKTLDELKSIIGDYPRNKIGRHWQNIFT